MTNAEIADLRLDALAAERGTAASSLKTSRRGIAGCLGRPGERRLAAVNAAPAVGGSARVAARGGVTGPGSG